MGINQVKVGVTIELDGNPFMVVNVEHVKPGKGSAFVRAKLKSLKNQALLDRTFKSDDKIEEAFIEERNLQYSYHSGDFYHFIDTETYEDLAIEKDKLHETDKFLKDDLVVTAMYYKKELIGVTLPNFVVYTITHTEPGIKGDTAKSGTKPATLETGAVVQVPLFIDVGTKIKVDTRTGGYIERAV
ncbi:MAG: elongation factor P [Candidatus Omnitrophica bacterium]|nr:elongation factor P [Candidatus Omnitrophota bacterium]MDD5574031.1 elongation factor P [Candidatus Omnitrophota bacterium]